MNTIKRIVVSLLALAVVFTLAYVADPTLAMFRHEHPWYRMAIFVCYVVSVHVTWLTAFRSNHCD